MLLFRRTLRESLHQSRGISSLRNLLPLNLFLCLSCILLPISQDKKAGTVKEPSNPFSFEVSISKKPKKGSVESLDLSIYLRLSLTSWEEARLICLAEDQEGMVLFPDGSKTAEILCHFSPQSNDRESKPCLKKNLGFSVPVFRIVPLSFTIVREKGEKSFYNRQSLSNSWVLKENP